MQDQKESVALSSVIASAVMTLMKLVVGLMTGSLGILSEAAHSLLDLGAAALTWFAVRVSDKPADAQHPYGHGKVENVSALIETGLLFVTSAWIVKEAVARLMADSVQVETTWYGVAVIVVSIIIDFTRARALYKVAKATGSQALEADALHFSSDIYSSAVVLLGLGLVALGWEKGDAVAAIGVAGFVVLAGYRMGRRTIEVLIDTAPDGVAEQVREMLEPMPEVARIDRIRARPAGATIFVEVVIKISRVLSFEQAQQIKDTIRTRIAAALPNVDPMVVAEPLTLDNEDIAETVRIAAANQGLSVHDIGLYTIKGKLHVGFDLEVADALSLGQAHDVANALEIRLHQELGADVGVDIHIDPRRSRVMDGQDVSNPQSQTIGSIIDQVVADHPLASQPHRMFVQQGPDGLYVSFHCRFDPGMAIAVVHDATVQLEQSLRNHLTGVGRVVIHAEPIL